MRIISGKYRGKKLNSPAGDNIRPTTDMVKENVFNIMQTRLIGCAFLDLFAGSGAIGIEAISRGAVDVVFCDIDRTSLQLAKSNTDALGLSPKFLLADYRVATQTLKGKQFDIIYLDPPYGKVDLNDVLQCIANANLLSQSGIVILESNIDTNSVSYNQYYSLVSSRRYGTVTIQMLKRNTRALVMGSFDPITLGHLDIIKRANDLVDEVVVCVMINPDKEGVFDIATRIRLIKLATEDMPVQVDSFKGMCYDYCIKNSIDVIVRGYRDENDYAYEKEMADFNKEHCGVETILLEADKKLADVSSSLVREKIFDADNFEEYLPLKVAKYIREYLAR